MGKQPWAGKNSYGAQYSKYWRGAWPRQQEQSHAFPAYDQRRGYTDWDLTPSEPASQSSKTSLVSLIQAAINQTRKAEQKVIPIEKQQTARTALWEKYEADLKAAYTKEHGRYNREMDRLKAEHAKAITEQEATRQALLQIHLNGVQPEGQQEDARVEKKFAAWKADEEEDANAVLHRALAAHSARAGMGLPGPASSHLPVTRGPPPGFERPDVTMQDAIDQFLPAGMPIQAIPELPPANKTFSEHPAATAGPPFVPSPSGAYGRCKPPSPGPNPRVGPYAGLAEAEDGRPHPSELAECLAHRRAIEPFGGPQNNPRSGQLRQIDPNKPTIHTVIEEEDQDHPPGDGGRGDHRDLT